MLTLNTTCSCLMVEKVYHTILVRFFLMSVLNLSRCDFFSVFHFYTFCPWCRFLHFYTLYFYKSLRKCLWHCYRFSPPWSFSPRWLHTPQTRAWSLSVGGSTCRSSLWPTLRSAYCRCLDDCNYYLKVRFLYLLYENNIKLTSQNFFFICFYRYTYMTLYTFFSGGLNKVIMP